MKLYDFLNTKQRDYDTSDNVYDSIITVCYQDYVDDEMDTYDKFCKVLYQLVDVVECVDDCTIVVNWSELIMKNKQKFTYFAQQYWKAEYPDDDVFMLAWLHELHLYLAGYVSESFYTILLNFVTTLTAV